MRLFQVKIKEEKFSEYRKFFDQRVIPVLQKMPGCLFACLTQSQHPGEEFIAITMWDSQEHAEAFAQSDLRQQLVQEQKPFFADSSEWKIELSKEMTLEYRPVPTEPIVKSYTVSEETKATVPQTVKPQRMYLRLVSAKIKPGMLQERKRIYQENLPILLAVRGCRYAFLTENAEDPNEVVSVTIWDSQQDAENYERSGVFDQLIEKGKHTFSELYQWKMGLEKEVGKKVVTSEDLTVECYQVVTGQSFS